MKYLIIGRGRSALHFDFYLRHLGHQCRQWHHKSHSFEELHQLFTLCDRALLLIKDSAIEAFLMRHPFLRTSKCVHFSGALWIEGIENVHPLISLGQELFAPDFYSQIPFAIFSEKQRDLSSILPGLNNPAFIIPPQAKALYHGLCVASGNLTVLLWQIVGQTFRDQWGLKEEWLKPYLDSVTFNLKSHWKEALTGPIARRDEQTLLKNYTSLQNTSLRSIFEAHVMLAWPEFAEKYFDPAR